MLRGIDISAWQGDVDLAAEAHRYGLDFVGIKATEGASGSDRYFSQNWARAKATGLVRIAYHFARPEASSAQQQADRLLFAAADAGPGDILCLDLEASELSQAGTNAWARAFGARLRERAPHVTTMVYLGSGYASNNTGRGLADYFDRWWYPQYPSTKSTTTWPSALSPWLPSGITTGWARPHIWQWTDHFAGKYDANISNLTIDQLAVGGGRQEETMPFAGQIPAGRGQQVNISFPRGSLKAAGFVCDNSLAVDGVIEAEPQPEIRYAFHRYDGTWQAGTVKVGSADGGKDHSPKQVIKLTSADKVDYASFTMLSDGTRAVGWDMS
jgi:hypothetical protein